MQIKYLHELQKPMLPAVGDIRVFAELTLKKDSIQENERPVGKIRIVRCVQILEHHAIYEFIGDKNHSAISIPFELIQDWGFQSIDSAITSMLNAYMKTIIDLSSHETSSGMFAVSSYYKKMENLMILSRQLLKEADDAKKTYQKFLEQ